MTRAKLIEDLLPPLVYRLLLRIYLLARGLGWHRFYGCYPTLAEVPGDREGQNSDWYAANAAKEVESLKFELSHRPTGDEAPQLRRFPLAQRPLADCHCAGFWRRSRQGTKTDLEHVPNLDLTKSRYVLVETSAMCRAVGNRRPFH